MRLEARLVCNRPPRWHIFDLDTDHYWTGEKFSPEEKEALIYEDSAMLPYLMQRIVRRKCLKDGKQLFRFQAPVTIEVFADKMIAEMDIARYLAEASQLNIFSDIHGNGPQGSVVLPTIQWQLIERIFDDDE